MIIYYIAWGSLLWNFKSLKIETEWTKSNIKFPLNFSRISDSGQGRLTLVIDKTGKMNNVYYARTSFSNLNTAIEKLKMREKTSYKNIGYIHIESNTFRTSLLDDKKIHELINFAKKNKIDGLVWTEISPNFEEVFGKPYSKENAIEYIESKHENKKLYNKILE
jgi:membrane-anchored protein YejM (alkaline phosphatase superfamily)